MFQTFPYRSKDMDLRVDIRFFFLMKCNYFLFGHKILCNLIGFRNQKFSTCATVLTVIFHICMYMN